MYKSKSTTVWFRRYTLALYKVFAAVSSQSAWKISIAIELFEMNTIFSTGESVLCDGHATVKHWRTSWCITWQKVYISERKREREREFRHSVSSLI